MWLSAYVWNMDEEWSAPCSGSPDVLVGPALMRFFEECCGLFKTLQGWCFHKDDLYLIKLYLARFREKWSGPRWRQQRYLDRLVVLDKSYEQLPVSLIQAEVLLDWAMKNEVSFLVVRDE